MCLHNNIYSAKYKISGWKNEKNMFIFWILDIDTTSIVFPRHFVECKRGRVQRIESMRYILLEKNRRGKRERER